MTATGTDGPRVADLPRATAADISAHTAGGMIVAMDDLVAFLNARLDEDEETAKAAWGVEWDWRYVTRPFGERPSIAHTVHIARHDPARVLREVAFKRAILDPHQTVGAWSGDNWPLSLRLLLAVWSDHPDYQPEWAP